MRDGRNRRSVITSREQSQRFCADIGAGREARLQHPGAGQNPQRDKARARNGPGTNFPRMTTAVKRNKMTRHSDTLIILPTLRMIFPRKPFDLANDL